MSQKIKDSKKLATLTKKANNFLGYECLAFAIVFISDSFVPAHLLKQSMIPFSKAEIYGFVVINLMLAFTRLAGPKRRGGLLDKYGSKSIFLVGFFSLYSAYKYYDLFHAILIWQVWLFLIPAIISFYYAVSLWRLEWKVWKQ